MLDVWYDWGFVCLQEHSMDLGSSTFHSLGNHLLVSGRKLPHRAAPSVLNNSRFKRFVVKPRVRVWSGGVAVPLRLDGRLITVVSVPLPHSTRRRTCFADTLQETAARLAGSGFLRVGMDAIAQVCIDPLKALFTHYSRVCAQT